MNQSDGWRDCEPEGLPARGLAGAPVEDGPLPPLPPHQLPFRIETPTLLTHASAGAQLTNTILDIVQQAANYKQLKKGANEGDSPHRAVRTRWRC